MNFCVITIYWINQLFKKQPNYFRFKNCQSGLPVVALAQSGQTLIETIVAILVLTTALTTGLALIISSVSSSTTSQNQLIATSLAKEGIEAVRKMRDTNWLESDAKGGSYDLQSCGFSISPYCYPRWLDGVGGSGYSNYAISESNSANRWRLQFNSSNRTWSLENNNNYNLYLQSDGTYTHDSNGGSNFARRIKISYNTAAPYDAQNPEVIVQAIVGWRGKTCTAMTNQDPETTNCKTIMEERLTNWKDYK